jgi:hypothetical protein
MRLPKNISYTAKLRAWFATIAGTEQHFAEVDEVTVVVVVKTVWHELLLLLWLLAALPSAVCSVATACCLRAVAVAAALVPSWAWARGANFKIK